MKRSLALLAALLLLITLSGCAHKRTPAIKMKHDSVTSIDFKRTVFSEVDPLGREYYQKTVTERADIENILDWIEGLKLTEHSAIEVPIDQVKNVIVLKGKSVHKLVFFDGYAVYDNVAFTYDEPSMQDETIQKYNLLNYPETKTELELV